MVDVELAHGPMTPTVLALEAITDHEIATSEANCRTTVARVSAKMNNPRNAQHAADDRQRVVDAGANWQPKPAREIEQLAICIQRLCGARVKQPHRTPHGSDPNRLKQPVQHQDR